MHAFDIGNIGETNSTIGGRVIVFYSYHPDDTPENPMAAWDGQGTIYSFKKSSDTFDPEAAHEAIASNPDHVKLAYFEHSQCLWMVSPEEGVSVPAGVEFQWDGVKVAGVWVPDECALENIAITVSKGKDRREALIEYAKSVVDVYTDYCNGNVYYYRVVAYRFRRDANGEIIEDFEFYQDNNCQEVYEDSCGGIFGASCESEIRSAVEYALNAHTVDPRTECVNV